MPLKKETRKPANTTPPNQGGIYLSVSCAVKTRHPIWTFVSGTAYGRITRIAPKTFAILPTYIEDYKGRYTGWEHPSAGQPINAVKTLRTLLAARLSFAIWAQLTFEHKWQLAKVLEPNQARDGPAVRAD